jgi:hypothetical protein
VTLAAPCATFVALLTIGYTSGDTPTMAGKDSHVDEDEERSEDLPPENI